MRISKKIQRLIASIHTIIGAPNYEQYVNHMKTHHPNQPILKKGDFYQQMIDRKYNSKTANRCC